MGNDRPKFTRVNNYSKYKWTNAPVKRQRLTDKECENYMLSVSHTINIKSWIGYNLFKLFWGTVTSQVLVYLEGLNTVNNLACKVCIAIIVAG